MGSEPAACAGSTTSVAGAACGFGSGAFTRASVVVLPGPDEAAYVLSRVPSQYTHRSCSASYSHTDSPSTTIPTRSPCVRRRKVSPSACPDVSSCAARRYRLSDSSARASSGRGSAVLASG